MTWKEIGQWLMGEYESNRRQIRAEMEEEYSNEHNRMMQKWEDDQWDRDIEHRAQTMLRERNHQKDQWNIKIQCNPGNEILQRWAKMEPLMVAPLSRKLVYTVHDKSTCRYPDTSMIHQKLMERYQELCREYDSKPSTENIKEEI